MRIKTSTPPIKAVVENAPMQSLMNSCAILSYRLSFVFIPTNSMTTANIGTPKMKDPNSRCSWAAIQAAVAAADPRGRGGTLCQSHLEPKTVATVNNRYMTSRPNNRYNLFLDPFILECLGRYIIFPLLLQTESRNEKSSKSEGQYRVGSS